MIGWTKARPTRADNLARGKRQKSVRALNRKDVSSSERQFFLSSGGSELLDETAGLWEQLNRHHATLSPHFAEHYERKTFAERRAGLLCKAEGGSLHVELALDQLGDVVGYCVSTVDPALVGEIDSLFVLPSWRGMALGHTLITRSLDWLREQGVQRTRLSVAAGNEQAFGFYAKHGFFPAKTILEQ